jgi:hypothetical protein
MGQQALHAGVAQIGKQGKVLVQCDAGMEGNKIGRAGHETHSIKNMLELEIVTIIIRSFINPCNILRRNDQ